VGVRGLRDHAPGSADHAIRGRSGQLSDPARPVTRPSRDEIVRTLMLSAGAVVLGLVLGLIIGSLRGDTALLAGIGAGLGVIVATALMGLRAYQDRG
jgi:hypothetical protein